MTEVQTKEDSLLIWLGNTLEKTQTELDSLTSTVAYWKSGEYKNHASNMHMSETTVKELVDESLLQITALAYRLNWINQQIEKEALTA